MYPGPVNTTIGKKLRLPWRDEWIDTQLQLQSSSMVSDPALDPFSQLDLTLAAACCFKLDLFRSCPVAQVDE